MEITRFNDELVTHVVAGTPIIVIDYKNTDKNSAFDMVESLLRQINKGLWFLCPDKDDEENKDGSEGNVVWYIQHYSWKGKPKKIDPYDYVPKSKWKSAGKNKNVCELPIDDVILQYVLPSLGKQEILAFFEDDFINYWDKIKIKLIEEARKHNKTVLVLTDVFSSECIENARVEKWGFVIDHWLPNEDELAENLKEYCQEKDWAKNIKCDFGNEDFSRLASLLVGCDFYEAQKKFMVFIIRHCHEMFKKGDKFYIIGKNAVDEFEAKIKEEFQRAENSHGLERIQLENFDKDSVAGLENLKKWLETKKKILSLIEVDGMKLDKSSSLERPRGVLLGGIPGCGKSLSAKCIAVSFGVPLYRLDFATVRSSYIAGSQQNLKETLDFASSRAPCILWIDEIEKGISGVTGRDWADSVERQMLGMFLYYLQENKANVFIVATANDVQLLPAELTRKGRFDEIFFLDLPNETERKQILKMYLKKHLEIDLSEEYAEEMVKATHGFTPADIDAILIGLQEKKVAKENPDTSETSIIKLFRESTSFSKINPKRVNEIRTWGIDCHAMPASISPNGKEEFKRAENLHGLDEISLTDFDKNSVVGLENLKKWLKTRKEIFSKDAELISRGLSFPRGVLLGGIPGCGKTLSAKCIAASFGMHLYRLDFGTVQNKWVGESEQNLAEALAFASSKAPCVLLIDEIEKGLATRSDEPWTKKLLGMFLYYLQENKAKVFVVATANDVQLLPAELIRKGRFDEIFFLDLPNETERKEIIKMYLKKYFQIEDVAKEMAVVTDGFTPSDIESVLRELAYEKIADKNLNISEDFIIERFRESTCFSKTSPERVKEIRAWGKGHAKTASSDGKKP
jgi:SpoVK/Ycf46/Vps4 family AAA+-type ATPase